MSLADAKGILTGGEDAGTQYFRRATGEQSIEDRANAITIDRR